jgi:hypothetical protein
VSSGAVAEARDIVRSSSGFFLINFGWSVICERWAGGGCPGHHSVIQWLCHDQLWCNCNL